MKTPKSVAFAERHRIGHRRWRPPPRKGRIKRGDTPVTICVATLSVLPLDPDNLGQIVIGASDRMLTADDVEFEPQQTKVFVVSRSITVMTAGQSAMQNEILDNVMADVNRRIQLEPDNWWKVVDVADLYVRYYNQARLRRSEHALLAPLGLTHDTFVQRQREMSPKLAMRLAEELIGFQAPGVEAIISGIDDTGAHIISVDDGKWTLQDVVGFAAIGAGYWHANSHLMLAGHTRFKLFPEALLATYSAKKKAEVAPGVGEVTDMFLIGPQKGTYSPVGEPLMKQLDDIFNDTHRAIQSVESAGVQRITDHVVQTIKTAVEQAKDVAAAGQVAPQAEPSGAEVADQTQEDKGGKS
ncbi:MAG: hypothetical protein ACHQ9S_03065 [Candidatus Binatia bacterium]